MCFALLDFNFHFELSRLGGHKADGVGCSSERGDSKGKCLKYPFVGFCVFFSAKKADGFHLRKYNFWQFSLSPTVFAFFGCFCGFNHFPLHKFEHLP